MGIYRKSFAQQWRYEDIHFMGRNHQWIQVEGTPKKMFAGNHGFTIKGFPTNCLLHFFSEEIEPPRVFGFHHLTLVDGTASLSSQKADLRNMQMTTVFPSTSSHRSNSTSLMVLEVLYLCLECHPCI